MKDKLTKTNTRKFDQFIKKLSYFSMGLMSVALVVIIPLNANVTKQNETLNVEIGQLKEDYEVALNYKETNAIMKIKVRDYVRAKLH